MTNHDIDQRLLPIHTLLTHAMVKGENHKADEKRIALFDPKLLAKEVWELVEEAEELLNNLRNDLHSG